ncbi:hypothetical protein FKW77_008583 [Venturia effusa]|uniref:Galactose oxidase-like Early set domain-containing protein n=1 Tax=Venturia effusa TaxID=50376 RepID=A0A517L9S7_9PEZI|nr:hypothetical protein FKW77_008583 [Venturia effusa]
MAANMQGDLFSRGFPRYDESCYFFSISDDQQRASDFVKRLAQAAKNGEISSLQKVLADWDKVDANTSGTTLPITNVLVAFTMQGLMKAFNQAGSNETTFTATWDRTAGTVVEKQVRNDQHKHDMFCPGTAYDAKGRLVISGGVSSASTTVYESLSDSWRPADILNIPRGYQGSTTFGDGRIFVIGGSWAPEEAEKRGNKNGAMFDPDEGARTWHEIDDCPAKPLQTTSDWQDDYRNDNHIWLFSWKDNSIFHAGPAKQMKWITVTGRKGAVKPAGPRAEPNNLADGDAMCGVAVMYDATNGKILSTGGAPQYKICNDETNGDAKMHQPSTKNAFVITLKEANGTVQAGTLQLKEAAGSMKFERIFHNAVVLPNGSIFVVGGQLRGQGFTDQPPRLTPEIYTPEKGAVKDSWQSVAPHSTVRVYHSFALLLPSCKKTTISNFCLSNLP